MSSVELLPSEEDVAVQPMEVRQVLSKPSIVLLT